ncbi:MAG TPA: HdeD family acid-resistance protein [Hyphomicrobium sp.]|jgi:uncharacterized membrane protein HdeD (DUF308 family)|uniref:HdeD family acid-resistance protein n=1 Tax=Hyphomicrobium sp. TaxID=82 RepID=UPI002CB4C414|nr:HdeD family acid-resistance protein [Hyphomicrobium sp.]HXE01365.1 HdeD family acid-resistance protein [Hyphomicrobium sp.]
MSIDQSGISLFRQELASSLHDHWKSYLFEGIVLLLLGAAAIIVPQIATLTVALLIGWLLLFSGVIGLITTFQMRPAPGFWWSLVSALIAIAAGVVLLASPAGGAITLTFVLIAFFIIEGIASIMFALDHRQELPGSWGAMLFSGIVDLVLGGMIFLGLPSSAAWAIGLLVGINMLFGGAALIAMALHARKLNTPSSLRTVR